MKLQISFDMTDLEHALDVAYRVAPYADIIEVGTLLIYQHGVNAVKQFKEKLPHKIILADAKISDRGKEAVTLFSHAGADWITVMAGTSKNVVHSACAAAQEQGKKIILDLLDASAIGQTAMEAKTIGVHALLFHQPADDLEPFQFLEKWEMIRGNSSLPIYVSAKIRRDTIAMVIDARPDGIVIGKGIVEAESPETEARHFKELIG